MTRMLGKMEMDMCPVCKMMGRKNAEHVGRDCANRALDTKSAKIKERRWFSKAVNQGRFDEI